MRHPTSFYVALLKKLSKEVEQQEIIQFIARAFFEYVASQNDTKILKKILNQFVESEKEEKKIAAVVMEITEHEENVEALKEKILHKLKDQYTDVVVETQVRKELLTGTRITVDKSYAIDASIRDIVTSLFG